jgi:hypothetical protein
MATFEITVDDETICELLHGDRGIAAPLEPIMNQIPKSLLNQPLLLTNPET